MKFLKNGSDFFYGNWANAVSGHSSVITGAGVFDLVATDYIEVQHFQDSGGNRTVDFGIESFFQVSYLGA